MKLFFLDSKTKYNNNLIYSILIISLFLIFSIYNIQAQTSYYRVFLKDKGPEEFKPGTSLYDSTLKIYTKRAIDRRKKVKPADSIFSIEDAPIYFQYSDRIEQKAKIVLKLRWFNYVVVECDSATSEDLKNFTFVKDVTSTGNKYLIQTEKNIEKKSAANNLLSDIFDNCGEFIYGQSYNQAALLNVPIIHQLGITGDGVLLGFLDSGFRWRKHSSTQNASVLAEYDFIFNDTITANEPVDVGNQDGHGSLVFSTVAGFSQGNLIGIAPSADFLLSKTEDLRSETHKEEDNYAAALEWMESLGVDITTSSLGYFYFDSTNQNYTFNDLDGKTTISAQAINKAVARGVICFSAAGNSGPSPMTIITPADADSCIAVAAVQSDGKKPAGFTSRGPRGDGKRKPDIAAKGVGVVAADLSNPYSFFQVGGTSLATPLIAGTATLIMSVFPELKPYELRNLLFNSGSQADAPDDTLGYGVPDILKAMESWGIIISPVSTYTLKQYQRILVNILSNNIINSSDLYLSFDSSSAFNKFPLYKTIYLGQYVADVPLNLFNYNKAEGYIIAEDSKSTRRMPYDTNEYFEIQPYTYKIQCGIDQSTLTDIVADKNNAYVYPSIVEGGRQSIELIIPLNKSSSIQVDIFSLLGQRLYSQYIPEREAGIGEYSIPVSNYAIGAYFINLNHSGTNETIPFIITK
ncbi:MAG: S8 family peptidase [FCB group bacterium]|jgi:hypothetical protein